MVGSAILRKLQTENCAVILTAPRNELNLLDQSAVANWVETHKPDAVFLAAAKVGGIVANATYPAQFLYENSMIQSNIIHSSYLNNVEKLLFLGSSCIYPKFAEQPISEDSLLTGPLEPTNKWYALAKISGIMMCQSYRKQYGCDYVSAMPTNLYGPGDNFHLENSHVIPALLRKTHKAKQAGSPSMEIWGTGKVWREFMHVDDCADALIFIMKNFSQEQHINIGQGSEITIEDLAKLIMTLVGFNGTLSKDLSRPDGTPRKIMDNSKLKAMGWEPQYTLETGLLQTYRWFLENEHEMRL